MLGYSDICVKIWGMVSIIKSGTQLQVLVVRHLDAGYLSSTGVATARQDRVAKITFLRSEGLVGVGHGSLPLHSLFFTLHLGSSVF
jgi:hypothetical protein